MKSNSELCDRRLHPRPCPIADLLLPAGQRRHARCLGGCDRHWGRCTVRAGLPEIFALAVPAAAWGATPWGSLPYGATTHRRGNIDAESNCLCLRSPPRTLIRRDRLRAPAWALPVEQCRRGCDRCPGVHQYPPGLVGSPGLRSLDAYRGKYVPMAQRREFCFEPTSTNKKRTNLPKL